LKATAPRLYRALWNKWYVDEAYQAGIVEPARSAGRACVGIDDYVVDGLVWLVTAVPRALGYTVRTLQSGFMQGYALTMVTGIAILVLFTFGS
ncbi:MAG: NADH-quinone oxidoreductase subunit L, partial [Planctomycetota bacterium]